ncbi:MAG: hypothetical protein R2855_01565 [Thermomicrobiales bacterium]
MAGRDADKAQARLAGCMLAEASAAAARRTSRQAQCHAAQVVPAHTSASKLPNRNRWLDRFAERLLPGVPAIKAATIAVALLFISVTAFDVLTNQSAQESMGPTTVKQEADVPAHVRGSPNRYRNRAFGPCGNGFGNAAPEPDSAPGECHGWWRANCETSR